MKMRLAILAFLPMLAASPAHAEKLLFDHQLYPQIGAVLDSGHKEMVIFDDRNPKYVFDRIAIQGTSAENWTEALEIIVRTPEKRVKSPSDWVQQISAPAAIDCAVRLTPIAEDSGSITVMRQASACAAAPAETAIYRIVAGTKSLFLLGARYKGEMDPVMRERWLRVLASARIEK